MRTWTRLFADCYREVNKTWPTGYDPESKRFPEPKVAQAALWFERNITASDAPRARLLAALRGEFYATPPANLAEFRVQYDRLTNTNRKGRKAQPKPVKSKYDQWRTT